MPKTKSTSHTDTLPVPGLLAGELAAALRTTPRTLAVWEREGRIPPAIRIGRRKLWPAGTVERLLGTQAGAAA